MKFARIVENQCAAHPFNCVEKLDGECIHVPVAAIYHDLVPFGRSYRNISGDLSLSRTGALGCISGGDAEADDELLGSPFPFDAVLQMACIWAQRFTDVVPFPVGFCSTDHLSKDKKRSMYLGRIKPVTVASPPFVLMPGFLMSRGQSVKQFRDSNEGCERREEKAACMDQ